MLRTCHDPHPCHRQLRQFVFTLVGYIQQLGAETTVIRNDEYELDAVIKLAEEHDGVLVSRAPAPLQNGRYH